MSLCLDKCDTEVMSHIYD